VPKLLDSSWALYSIVFTPVGDLFFGLGFDFSSQGMAKVFWFDPTHENWSVPTPILGGLGLKITTIKRRDDSESHAESALLGSSDVGPPRSPSVIGVMTKCRWWRGFSCGPTADQGSAS